MKTETYFKILFITAAVCLILIGTKACASKRVYRVSAYCPCEKCCGKWANEHPQKTASGHIVQKGDKFVAAPKDIPFGTVLIIPEYGTVKVEDRGGAIKDNRLDVFFDTHQEALNWGIKYLEVERD